MSANGSRSTATNASAAEAALDVFNRRSLETAFTVANSVLKGWESISEAWIGFSRSQMESNIALMQSLAKCDSPLAALSLQLDGAQATMSRCMTAATKTSDVASKIAVDALAPLQAQHPQRAA
jgi:hypothetical protein